MTEEQIAQYEIRYEGLLRQQKIMEKQFELIRKEYARDSVLYEKGSLSGKEPDNSKSQYLEGLLSRENMQSTGGYCYGRYIAAGTVCIAHKEILKESI